MFARLSAFAATFSLAQTFSRARMVAACVEPASERGIGLDGNLDAPATFARSLKTVSEKEGSMRTSYTGSPKISA
jgi:hypothetical protein